MSRPATNPARPPIPRPQVVDLYRRGEPYGFLDAGWKYLCAVPHDPEIAALVTRSLLDVGLGGVARELLQSRPDLRADEQCWTSWRQQSRSAPSGRVPWVDLEETFRSNLALLLRTQSHLSGIEAQLRSAVCDLHLHRTADGRHLLSRRRPGHYREWVSTLADPASQFNCQLPGVRHGTPLFIGGLPSWDLPEQLHAATAELGINQTLPIFLLEPDLSSLSAWLHLADRSALLEDPRVYVVGGPRLLEMLEELLSAQDDLAVGAGRVITPPGRRSLKDEVAALHARVFERRSAALRELERKLEQRHAQRDIDYWRQRLADGGPVVALTTRATTMLQYSARDIGHALEELGREFHLVIEAADHRPVTQLQIARTLWEVDPSLVILIDHLRYEDIAQFYNIPLLTWVQDPLPNILCREAGESIGPLDFVCGYYKQRCVEQYGYPEERYFECTVPASTRVFHDGPIAHVVGRRRQTDVVYVGHRPDTAESLCREWIGRSAVRLHPLLERIRDEVTSLLQRGAYFNVRGDSLPLVDALAAEMNVELKPELRERIANFFAYRLFDIGYRRQTLEWARCWALGTGRKFVVYGNGWCDDAQFAPFAAGAVGHGEPLRQVYRCAHLAIQTIPSGFLHQRTYEAVLSGALVLSRHNPKHYAGLAREEFDRLAAAGQAPLCAGLMFPRLEEVVFADAEQFERLAERYLDDAQLRDELLEEFKRCVRQHCTYTSVVSDLLDKIRHSVGEAGE